ncbi:hypothetical protein [Streptomyces winkii]|uniref:hypothetical protein n=1 Tax=Streptomyces winkii TaxID=3051178 RepID=UPI0028D3DF4C|nr:hypothetical protein [Streptomyces sp. DSM 40971]
MNLTTEARLGWIMPSFMQDLPLEAVDEDDLVDKVCDLSRTILENRDDDDQAQFAVVLFHLVAQLVEVANAVYAGMAFLDIDGRPSMATVLVSRSAHEASDEQEACETAEAALRSAYPDDDIRTVELPRVWAVTRIAASPISMPADLSPDGTTHIVARNIIQAYVPIPYGKDFLVFELSTTSLEDWDLYSELFAEILRTIDWTTDEEIAEQRRLAEISATPQKPSISEDMTATLHLQSSRVMDLLQCHGQVLEGGDGVSAIVCDECWSKGLRAACVAEHRWGISVLPDGDIEAVLDRVVDSAAVQNDVDQAGVDQPTRKLSWSVCDETGATFRVDVSGWIAESRIDVRVSSACWRRNDTRLSSDFG